MPFSANLPKPHEIKDPSDLGASPNESIDRLWESFVPGVGQISFPLDPKIHN